MMGNEKIYNMSFKKVYSLLIAKAEKKGRSRQEVNEIASWLTGYTQRQIEEMMNADISYGNFFRNAPSPNPKRKLIRGTVWDQGGRNRRTLDAGNTLFRQIS